MPTRFARLKFQGKVSDRIARSVFPDSLFALIRSRLVVAFGFSKEVVKFLEVEAAAKLLLEMRPSHSLCWLRSVFNSWVTTRRFPAAVRRSCVFGCLCEDALTHYVVCPPLFSRGLG